MIYYRLYLLNAKDHIFNVVEFNGPDDLSAMDKARSLADGHAIDVWAGVRKVGRIQKKQAPKDCDQLVE
jgi:hypothetical protein